MKKCKYCKIEIETDAKLCPHCKKKQGFPKWAIILIVIVIIVVLANMGNENGNDGGSQLLDNKKPQVTVIDFSEMSIDDISTWCSENNVNCYKKTDYSATVEKDGFISQSVKSGDKINEGKDINITYSLGKAPTAGQKNALSKAQSYLRSSSFSLQSLISQLEFEKFTKEQATYGAEKAYNE